MVWVVIFSFLILALVFLILFTKLNILIEYKKDGHDDIFVLSIFALKGLLKYKYEIPSIRVKNKGISFSKVKEKGKKEKDVDKGKTDVKYTSFIDRFEKAKELYEKYTEIIRFLKCRIILEKIDLNIVIGTGNAHHTAILTGLAWSFAGVLLSFFHSSLSVKEKHIDIKSDFTGKKLKIDLYCILKVKFVHIIVIGFMVLSHRIREKLNSVFKVKGKGCVTG